MEKHQAMYGFVKVINALPARLGRPLQNKKLGIMKRTIPMLI